MSETRPSYDYERKLGQYVAADWDAMRYQETVTA